MAKLLRGKTFAVFAVILQTTNVFPLNALDAKPKSYSVPQPRAIVCY